MKKRSIVLLSIVSTLAVAGTIAGITFAAYNAPSEGHTYNFGSMVNSDDNFQDLSYYFAGGNGTEGSPYIIKNSYQLRNLSKLQNSGALPNATYINLGASFEYEGDDLEPIGTSTYPFVGVFDGLSHSITGLSVSTSTLTNVGMFGYVGTTAATGTVQSIVLIGPSVSYTGTSAVNIGFVCGYKNTTTRASTVQNIEIYGGTTTFDKVRAHLYSGGTPTYGNTIVGQGGSTKAGFVSTISTSPTYSSTATYGDAISAGTHYYLYHNGTSVVKDS